MAARGQSYPVIDLEKAVETAKKIYSREHTSPLTRESAVIAMGYKSINGASARKLAALSAYGLLEGRDEDIKISADAITIIADEKVDDQADRIAALKRCLKGPSVFSELADKYDSASVDNIASFLMKQGFKSQSAKDAASTFRESISFVKRESGAYTSSQQEKNAPIVGDFVQWESEGALQFTEPKRVRAVTEDSGQAWVFVDGSETGIRAEEVKVEQPAAIQNPPKSPPRLPLEEAIPGETEYSRGALSKSSSFRLIIKGDVGATELGNLITLLEAQQKILEN